jgi:2-C-methyl-D-erythritol 4-phosphate cytidylyltransferase
MNKAVGIILAGGEGKRFGSKISKQLMSLNGKPVIQYVLDSIIASKELDLIIIVTNPKIMKQVREKVKGQFKMVKGGINRKQSVINGLKECPSDTKYVLFFDSVRPFLTPETIKLILKELKNGHKSVCTTQTITDALVQIDSKGIVKKPLNREEYRLCQTPEGFNYKLLCNKYFKSDRRVTAISDLITNTKTIDLINPNIKITYPKDLFNAEQLIKYKEAVKRTPKLIGKRILLTGASGGIGSEIKILLENGKATVFAPSRTSLNLEKLGYNNYNPPIVCPKHKYDCIILCGGTYARDDEGILKNYCNIMNTNFRSIIYFLTLAPFMLNDNGNIVIVGSASASYGRTGISLYSASKSALNSFVEAYSPTLFKNHGIKVNVICPAKVNTKLQQHINPNQDSSKMMSPNKIAEIITRYCDVDFTGHIVYIKEGLEDV